jgi:hypothetical protein
MPLQLFLIANMVCCTSAIPVLLGLVSRLHRFVGGASMVFSCLLSILLTSGAWWVHGCPVLMYVHKLCARSETCDTNKLCRIERGLKVALGWLPPCAV